MNPTELDQLVSQIGEEILARLSTKKLAGAEGLGISVPEVDAATERILAPVAIRGLVRLRGE